MDSKQKKNQWLKWFTFVALIVSLIPPLYPQAVAAAPTDGNVLTLTMNKAQVTMNGNVYKTAQPALIIKGVTYAPLSMFTARYGYSISYNKSTKEVTANRLGHEIRFKEGSSVYTGNGNKWAVSGKPYNYKGSIMIAVRDWSKATGSTLTTGKGTLSLTWRPSPTADFKVDQQQIYAGETQVTYTSLSKNADEIKSEVWTGNYSIFSEGGAYTVTRSVQDSTGKWSAPYSVSFTVLGPNQPPQAQFTTDKDIYKMGEPIIYSEQSTDDESAIVAKDWFNKKAAFFSSGNQTINLRVTDKHGISSEISKTITITKEVMYMESDFNQLFTPIGEKYIIDGTKVLRMTNIPYTYNVSDRKLIASDSPEDLTGPGILYQDSMLGDFRVFLYHKNLSTLPLTIYMAATNESLTDSATITLGAWGKAGPDTFGTLTGKMAAIRYLDSQDSRITSQIALAPGETKLIVPELGTKALNFGQILSAYADLNTSSSVKITLFAVMTGQDPLMTIPALPILERDGKHIRGTFQGADREVTISQTLGGETQRIQFGDHKNDPALDGIDKLNGQLENNWGNFGVVYHTVVQVKANTLIALNARGGIYSGAFRVNKLNVPVTNTSMLMDKNTVCPVYRTGPNDETVEISFLTALGSNLPINILFIPMPIS
ncbi:stalk domain-containing protein [Cohnella sp.]|uniref:stalk domain-containing protein n=1 Tax=Cohnella sp. TaxID=1883426 RepID=UPI0035629F6F